MARIVNIADPPLSDDELFSSEIGVLEQRLLPLALKNGLALNTVALESITTVSEDMFLDSSNNTILYRVKLEESIVISSETYPMIIDEVAVRVNARSCTVGSSHLGLNAGIVGLVLNTLYPRIPNFGFTLTVEYPVELPNERLFVRCNSTHWVSSDSWVTSNSRVISSYIPDSITLDIFARNNATSLPRFKAVLKQLFYAHHDAYANVRFSHYDFHLGNILISPIQSSRLVQYTAGALLLDTDLVTIIDFEFSHVVFRGEHLGCFDRKAKLYNRPFWVYDIFTVLMSLYLALDVRTESGYQQAEINNIRTLASHLSPKAREKYVADKVAALHLIQMNGWDEKQTYIGKLLQHFVGPNVEGSFSYWRCNNNLTPTTNTEAAVYEDFLSLLD